MVEEELHLCETLEPDVAEFQKIFNEHQEVRRKLIGIALINDIQSELNQMKLDSPWTWGHRNRFGQ